MSYKAIDIASEFITLGVQNGRPVTHMQLQKIIYYAQGWFMAAFEGKPLFEEEFKRWPFGPVCPPVYNKLKKVGGAPISNRISGSTVVVDADIKRYLKKIWDTYGKYNGPQLMKLSHAESPWLEADDFSIIPKESIYNFFRSQKDNLQAV